MDAGTAMVLTLICKDPCHALRHMRAPLGAPSAAHSKLARADIEATLMSSTGLDLALHTLMQDAPGDVQKTVMALLRARILVACHCNELASVAPLVLCFCWLRAGITPSDEDQVTDLSLLQDCVQCAQRASGSSELHSAVLVLSAAIASFPLAPRDAEALLLAQKALASLFGKPLADMYSDAWVALWL
jgi:hypothetical protein